MFLKGIKRIYGWYKKFKGEKTKELPSLQQVKTSKLTDQPLQNRNLRRQKSNSALSGNWNKKKNMSEVPAYAKGGVVSNPHLALVGDGQTPESIIPHDGSKQSKDNYG